jgi:hypothetical protein
VARFSEPIDSYMLFKIDLKDFRGRAGLPPDYSFTDQIPRDAERALLEAEFPHWQIPYERRMPGSRPDGVVIVAHQGEPVGIVYTCDRNELDWAGYSQGHYLSIRRDHRGRKLFNAMFTEMLRRTETWGLEGMLFIVDREGHRDFYERWGATFVRERRKSDGAPAAPAQPRASRVRSALRRILSR